MTDIDNFLHKLGKPPQSSSPSPDSPSSETNRWLDIIKPNSSYLIIGDVGTGKSALAWYLMETFSQRYNLLPVTVGTPRNKQTLLPPNYIILDNPDDCTKIQDAIVFIDEADLQIPIEDTKARQYVTNFLSLPRHRRQIFLLAFHFPRLVLGRYLPFFSAFLLKRPPYLIEFASKSRNDTLAQMMYRAEERFSELMPEDIVKNTYVVAPRLRWQGMITNGVCSFWNQQLSEVWAGVDIDKGQTHNSDIDQLPLEDKPMEISFVEQATDSHLLGLSIIDPGHELKTRSQILNAISNRYSPGIPSDALQDCQIIYPSSENTPIAITFPRPIAWK